MAEARARPVPTLYTWLGREPETFSRLIETFYDLTLQDPLLAPLFTDMPPKHRENVALWFAEVFGGPKRYSGERGSHRSMILKHQHFSISEAQRRRWAQLMADAADAVELPDRPRVSLGVYGLRRMGYADGAHVRAGYGSAR